MAYGTSIDHGHAAHPCAPSQLFEVLNRKLMLVDEIKNDPRKDAQVGSTKRQHGRGGGGEGGWAMAHRSWHSGHTSSFLLH